YLFTTLKYYIIKQVYPKAKRDIQVNLSTKDLEHFEFTTQDLLQYKQLQSIIAIEVDEFPERMKEINRRSRFENLQIAEIPAKLNISEQTIKNTNTTTLKRLQESLSHYYLLWIFLL
ncbi:MAG: hypothetical protein ABI185_03535, partial [Ginsengibacter sp.]